MKFLISCTCCFLFFTIGFAQEVKTTFYTGKVNNRSVRLYLKEEGNDCGATPLYSAIYQYGNGKNWIELLIQSDEKGRFGMTEYRFTGMLILKKTPYGLEGIWISPDGKTQLKVVLKKQALSPKLKEELEEGLERTHYENYDC